MNVKLSTSLSRMGMILALIGGGVAASTDVQAGDYRRHDGQQYRHRDVERDNFRHERERRAFVAGAVAQQHREYRRDYDTNDSRDGYYYRRDGYAERYRERYEDDDRHDGGNVAGVLIGAAVGAVVTGVVINNMNKSGSGTGTSTQY